MKMGNINNTCDDLLVLRNLRLTSRVRKAPVIHTTLWNLSMKDFIYMVPWNLRAQWRVTLRELNFIVSHIYRQGNRVADRLASFAILQ